jgi:hypothetical protein
MNEAFEDASTRDGESFEDSIVLPDENESLPP